MAGDLKFVISAVDNASKALGQVGRETEKLGKGVAGLNAAARVISAGAIIAFGAASVKAFAEAEKSQVKLEQAYKRFPALATVQISALREMNQALQEKTGADADSLAAAQATLAQFKLTGDQIKQLTPLLVDYAQVTGRDVTTAATSLGRAFMGNTRALKAIGIDFKATGDTAKDFQGIYAALEGQVGGAGEAFGQTTAGQLQILQKSFEDLQEEVGAQLVPALKSLVAVAKPILGAFGNLPEPVKSFTVAVGAAAAATLLLGPRILTMVAHLKLIMPAATPAAAGLTAEATAATAAGTASATAATKIGLLSKALGPVALGVTATVAAMEAWQIVLDRLGAGAEGVNGLTEAVQTNNAAAAEAALNSYQAAQAASSWQSALATVVGTGGAGFPIIVQGFRNAADATTNLDQQLAAMVSGGNAQSAESMLKALGISADEARAKFPEYAAALDAASGPAGTLAGTTGDLTDATGEATDAMSTLKAMLDDLGGTQMDSEKAFMRVQDAIDKATEAANANGRTLDMNTEAGRANRSALQGIATDALAAAAAYAANGESADSVKVKTQEARDAFIAVASQMGLSTAEAGKLADQYGLIPDKVSTSVTASGVADATTAVRALSSAIYGIQDRTATITVNIDSNYRGKPVPDGTGGATGGYFVNGRFHFDGGGRVAGPGTGTSDSIPAMLSNGEYVIRAAAVSRLGVGFLDDLNDNGRIDTAGYDTGGPTPNARFRRFQNATNTLIEEEQQLRDLIDARTNLARQTSDKFKDSARISNLVDTGAVAAARQNRVNVFNQTRGNLGRAGSLIGSIPQGDYAGAQRDVQAARQRLNMAATPQEAAAARKELAAAESKAAASKPSMGNLVKSLKAKARALTVFAADLRTLASKKRIPADMLKEIIDAGPEQGGQVAKMLLSASAPEMKELMAAQDKIAKASISVATMRAGMEAKGEPVTAGSIIKSVRGKMRQLETFAGQVRALARKKKIPVSILRDIIAAGPEEGGQIARALLAAKSPELAELIRLQNRVDEASEDLGEMDANLEYNPRIRRQRGVVSSAYARARARREEYLAVRTQVTIDGREVAEALANYKRAQGGRRLGLD